MINNKKYSKKNLKIEYASGTSKNLFLDKMTKADGHLSNLSTNKNGKEVSVGNQIAGYLKSMGLLEKSVEEIEETIESVSESLKKIDTLLESSIIKKRYNGKVYSTTRKMIEAVKLFDIGKIEKIDLLESARWAEDPEAAIRVARMIAGVGEFGRAR